MASVLTADSRDTPRLSLVIDRPPSSSPFPSPSSSFLPPPRPGAHEFASKPQSHFSRKKKDDEREHSTSTEVMPEKQSSPSMHTTSPDASITASTRDSLTSSRPAPPSPSLSRRTSAALSQRSSSSRGGGGTLSRNPSVSKRRSKLQHDLQLTSFDFLPGSASDPASRPRSLIVKIRDFAFPSSDDRHLGKGPDAPKPNKHRRSSDEISDEDDDIGIGEERRNSGWGGFVWTGLTNRLSWSFGAGRATIDGNEAPSKTDFERNFDVSSPMDEKTNFGEHHDEDEEEDDGYEDDEQGEGGSLLPGKYRAMYPFEPEGTAEMALEEDQIVDVVGRGGGVGWAVVEKTDGGHALVPESYLELVELKQ